ncbi:MAG: DUF4190 domain-containing protein [Phycisphaeraceae bacterium]
MIKVTCSACGKHFQTRAEFTGQTAKCPDCGAAIVIPLATQEAILSPAPLAAPLPPGSVLADPTQVRVTTPATSGLAIAALVCGLLGLCIPGLGIAALVLGIIAINQIGSADGLKSGRGMATAGAILGGVGLVVPVIFLLIGILLPALGAARRTARQMQNSTQIRGIVQGNILHAQGNSNFYPGLDSAGGLVQAGVTTGSYTTLETGESVPHRLAVLLNGNYLTPQYLVSPAEIDPSIQAAPMSAVVTANHSSFALLDISDAMPPGTMPMRPGRFVEWSATTDSQAVVAGDRNVGGNSPASYLSIHTAQPGNWRGSIGWNDNHTDFQTSPIMPNTKYGSHVEYNDDLFQAASRHDAWLIYP